MNARAKTPSLGAGRWRCRALLAGAVAVTACTAPPSPARPTASSPPLDPDGQPPQPRATSSIDVTKPPTMRSSPSSAATSIEGCGRDEDCTADFATTEGPFTCCSGCVARAVSKVALAAFRGRCAEAPPQMCPPLGCASAPTHAACEAGRCVLRVGEPPRHGTAGPLEVPPDCDPGGPAPRTCVPPAQTHGGPPGPGGCRGEPAGGICRGCRPRFEGVEGGLCCYTGLSRFPRCQ